jgi:L-serine/L-threonine ammonia-lyase
MGERKRADDIFRRASSDPAAPLSMFVMASSLARPIKSVKEVPDLHVRTPLVRSNALSALAERDVLLKLESAQPSGSFKLRGIGRTCALAVHRDGAKSLVSSSGGNAGLATAHAGRELGVGVEVFVPETTPERVRGLLRAYGADVIVRGAQWSEANEAAVERATSTGAALVHPFEGEDTWDGHSTLVDEIAEDLGGKSPAAIVTCVGGGGLLAGCLRGVERAGWLDETLVVAMETIGADSLNASVLAGKLATLPAITSVAKSLGAASPSPTVFARCVALGPGRVRSATCTDAQAVSACVRFADDHRILVEPACGAALSAVYTPELGIVNGLADDDRPIVVVVCGGSVVDRASLDALADAYL